MDLDLPSNVYLPLHSEIRDIAIRADRLLNEVWRPIVNNRAENEELALSLRFVDSIEAKDARHKIAMFRKARKRLGFISQAEYQKITSFYKSAQHLIRGIPTSVDVYYDEYIPNDYFLLVDDIRYTHLQFLPVSSYTVSSMQNFVSAYQTLKTIRVTCRQFWNDGAVDSCEHEVVFLHMALIELSRLVISSVLPSPPVTISILGTAKKLHVSINGKIADLSPNQTRGVAALAQVQYNCWFSAEEFCKIAFPNGNYEARKQFDAALSVLKATPPFGWDADEGLRRITGAVIRSDVDKAVLNANLSSKKSA